MAEDKIRIVLEGLRGEDSIAELCRREGIVQNRYYRWLKEFLEASKKRLAGDTAGGDVGRGQGPSPLEGRSDWAMGSRSGMAPHAIGFARGDTVSPRKTKMA